MKKILIGLLGFILAALLACWFLTFPVTLHDASGTRTVTYHFLTGLTLPAPETIPEGNYFDGWYYDKEYSTPVKSFDHHFGTVVVYAKYSPQTYSISYSYDTGTELNLTPTEYTYGTPSNLPELEKRGYKLVGWKTEDGKVLEKIDEKTFGDLKLTPEYELGRYKIDYELYGGELEGDPVKEYVYGEFPELLVKPVRNGYAFKYWTIKETGEVLDSVKDPAGDITLVANWEGIYDSTREGDSGKIQLGKYAALLYKGSNQERFSNENSAIIFNMGDKQVITDAYAQGFKVLVDRDEDLLWTVNGVTTRYKQVSKYIGHSSGNEIILDDRRTIPDVTDGEVCAYVQNTDGTLTVAFYKKVEE